MNLTGHQRKIINAIIDGNVYNIPTYLRYFQKGEVKKYNIDELRKKHKEAEKGKKYKVMKKGHSAYISISTEMQIGLLGSTSVPHKLPRNRKDITDDEWTNEEAKLIEKIPKTCFSFRETDYTFDFLEEGAFIANDFQDIIDFITLWSFLKNEALILELEQPVSIDEVSVFFEYRKLDKKSKEDESTVWVKTNDTIVSNDNELFKSLPLDFYEETPSKSADQYLDGIWEINDEHIIMCSDFIGKRIYPTSALRVYAKHYYRTVDELDRAINKWLASIALVISILSFAWSLLQPQADYHAELETIVETTNQLHNTIEMKFNSENNVDTMNKPLDMFEWLHLKSFCDSIWDQLITFPDMILDALLKNEKSLLGDDKIEHSEQLPTTSDNRKSSID